MITNSLKAAGWAPLLTVAKDAGLTVAQARELAKSGAIRSTSIPGFRRPVYSVADAVAVATEMARRLRDGDDSTHAPKQ